MEFLPGRDIQSYQYVDDAAFGFLLDFEAAAGATDQLLQQKLDLFCSECLVMIERERKMQDAIIDKNAIFYANGCFIRELDGVRRVILKCKRTVRHFWPDEFLVERGQKTWANKRRYRKFGELLRRFLCEERVAAADDSHAIVEENLRHTPPFLLMGETFVRDTTLPSLFFCNIWSGTHGAEADNARPRTRPRLQRVPCRPQAGQHHAVDRGSRPRRG